VVGCAAPADEPETVYDPCSPLRVAIAESATASEHAGVEGAIESWSARLPTRIAMQVGGTQAADVLPVRFESDSGLRGAYWDAVGVITIGADLLAPEEYPVAVAHEMGHAFGLPHTSERPSVMNVGNTTLAPTAEDAAAVAALWPSCTP